MSVTIFRATSVLTELTYYCPNGPNKRHDGIGLRFVFGLLDQFANHGLDDANVSIQHAAKYAAEKSDGEVGGEADNEEREHCARATEKKDRLSSDSIGQGAPPHAGEGLGEGEGRNEDSGVEGGIASISNIEALDHEP
jgi:hypothetical protein